MKKKPDIEDIYPLSPLQKGLLFHALFEPGTGVYFEQLTCEMHGRLDPEAFAGAWRLLVARHPILRTAFVWKGQREPVQVVHRQLEMPWHREDWRDLPESARCERLSIYLAEDRRRGFEPNRAPLMRLATLQIRDDVWQLVWSHHHLLLDGWSFPLLLREFAQAYGALSANREPGLPPVPPYSAYIAWLGRRDRTAAEKFWRSQLQGFTSPTSLGLAPPASRMGEETECALLLSEAETVRLQRAARESQVTLATLVQGAFALVLSRYGASSDVLFGVTVSGRPPELRGIEAMVGLFINTLPLRVRLNDLSEAGPWLRELQQRQLDLQEHGHSALNDIQGWSEIPRGQPLFESLFVFENYPVDEALGTRFGGLEAREVRFVERTNYPLTVVALPGIRMGLKAGFDPARIDRASAERLLGHVRLALEGLAIPTTRLGEIEIVGGQERSDLLTLPANTSAPPPETTLDSWFARIAGAAPSATAVTAPDFDLSYGELERLSERIARRLRTLGVHRGARVGLFCERGAALIAGLLGILKSGAAYVPLDPAYPDERLAFMIEDSGTRVVITQASLAGRIGASVVRLELEGREVMGGPADAAFEAGHGAEDAAYVIYTSGSTGRPKGCVVTHANVIRLFSATDPWFGFGPSDVWTFFHSAAFDFSVWEIWGALLYGGRLVAVPYFTSREPEAFLKLLSRERVTVLNQTPSAFRQLMQAEEGGRSCEPLALRLVIFGGEALELASLRPWFERHGDQRPLLVNMYGITETTVHVTYRPLCLADALEGRGSPIGEPIPDLRLVVADAGGRLVPVGVPGELYVGGLGLAQGYLDRPDLTATRFVPDFLGFSEGGRLYRTGDLARRTADGGFDYLCRIDDQVKIRGFRIELGEIEGALAAHPDLRSVAVMVREDEPGAKRLVAYAVARDGVRPSVEELRAHLLTRLPEYMVPAAFVVLGTFPLTPHGKVDRRALPAPEGRAAASAEYLPPRDSREQALADIWREVLGVERVGRRDSYFAMGGDSIRSITVRSRARDRGIEFSLQDLFEKQTIEALLASGPAQLQEPARNGADSRLRPLAPFALVAEADRALLPSSAVDAYPLTRLQAGMLFFSQGEDGATPYHDIFSHHLRGPFDPEAFRLEWAALIGRHPNLRTSFELGQFSEALQIVHSGVRSEVALDDLSALSSEEQERRLDQVFEEESRRPFEWSVPPLARVSLYRRGASEFQLVLAMHHVIVDGWSLAGLLTELFHSYLGRLGLGGRPALPTPAVSYADYVALERAALADPKAASFWSENLAGAEVLVLPGPEPGVAVDNPIRDHPVVFSRELVDRLSSAATALELPLKSLLLAAHVRVLGLIAACDDVVTGLVINGRPEEEGADRIAGLFLNTVPFRMVLLPGDWAGLAREAFRVETALLPHRRLPLPEIQKRCDRTFVTTNFNFINFHVYRSMMGGAIERIGLRSREETNLSVAANFSLDPESGALAGSYSCDRRFVSDSVAGALPGLFLAALEAMTRVPQASWRGTALLDGEIRQRSLDVKGESVRFPEGDMTLPDLVSAQVLRSPEAVAVVARDAVLTYTELERRSNQTARWLARRGVRPEDRVAVAMERSAGLVTALLGIMKAGAAYVPVDPAYPAPRVAGMLEDGDVCLTLADSSDWHPMAVSWTQALSEMAAESPEAPEVALESENLAYVIFTSGSSGRPKGVAVPHSALVNHMLWLQRAFPLGESDAVLQKTPTSFDPSVLEFWEPLIAGARLIMLKPGGEHDPEELAAAIREHGVSVLMIVPSVLDFVIEEAAKEPLPSLRWVYSGGEPLRAETRDRFVRHINAPLVNFYGPAECTIDTTSYTCPTSGPIAIGRPIANLECLILDSYLQPVPPGAMGELYVGGSGLARGYAGRADLTAERFIPHPFSKQPGARLYRTGDCVRQRPDGELVYLGRADNQVKIRGQRVEPGEVEVVLGEHPAVIQAAVVAREDRPGEVRLVAYATVRSPEASPAALKDFLIGRLSEVLVPAVVVILDRIPLAPGGKIDRRALPAPPQAQEPAGPRIAPATGAERALAAIWQEVLGISSVGAEDNFFELGGDSILGLRIVSLAARAGWKLRAPQIFTHPTLRALAAAAMPVGEVNLVERFDSENLPLTPIQREFWSLAAPHPSHWNQAVTVETRQGLSASSLQAAWRTLTRRHPAFRLRYTPDGAQWRQRLESESGALEGAEAVGFAVVDMSSCTGAEREAQWAQSAADAQNGLDLIRGPVAKAVFFPACAGKPGRLLLVAHHLIVDGVSWRILLEELGLIVEAAAGAVPLLPPVTLSFPAWTALQEGFAASKQTRAELEYWKGIAEADSPRVPLDSSDGARHNREKEAESVSCVLSVEETAEVLNLAPEVGRCRMDEVLLASLLASLLEWIGGDRVRVALERHGRENPSESIDLSRTVGWFTAIFPVLLSAELSDSAAARLRRVKETLRAVPHGGVGFGWLRHIACESVLTDAPRPEVSFNYLGRLDLALAPEGPFRPANVSAGAERDPDSPRTHLIDVVAFVSGDGLRVEWTFCRRAHRKETIERLAQRFLVELRALLDEFRRSRANFAIAADFPLVRLSSADCERVLARDPVDVEDIWPLTPLQEGMLLHAVHGGEPGVYNQQIWVGIRGELQPEFLERAWKETARRHPCLRLEFAWNEMTSPCQLVRRDPAVDLQQHDWSTLASAEQTRRWEEWLAEDRRNGFDLNSAPLWRLNLFRFGPDRWKLVWTHHHLLLDGWSLPLVFRDVRQNYGEALDMSRRQSIEKVLRPGPTASFRDYLSWLSKGSEGSPEAFWRSYLSGYRSPPALTIGQPPALDRPRPAEQSSVKKRLSESASEALRRFAQSHEITLGTCAQGAWALALARHLGAAEAVFGLVVSGRPPELPGVEAVVGVFINTVPVRVQVPKTERVGEWLRQLQVQTAAVRQYEHCRLVDIQGWSEVPRGQALFESILIVENYPSDAIASGLESGLKFEEIEAVGRTNLPLNLYVIPDRCLTLQVDYEVNRFSDEAMDALTSQVGWILESMSALAAAPVASLTLQSPAESARDLAGWNDTAHSDWERGAVHQRFSAQAARTPGTVAVVFGDLALTYAELEERSSRLARHLRHLGARSGHLVGICLERSPEMIVALLAILKSGAAYVPLDPAFPPGRLEMMREESALVLAVTDEALARLPGLFPSEVTCVRVDADKAAIEGRSGAPIAAASDPEEAAYVIFTSGSTGRPKGVQVTHGGLSNFLTQFAQEPGLRPDDVLLAVTTLSFDIAGLEIYLPLVTGARLVLADRETAADGRRLGAMLTASGATVMQATPATWRVLLESEWKPVRPLRAWCGGEAMPPDLAAALLKRGCEVWNLYGPTETTIWSTLQRIVEPADSACIGRPIAHTSLQVLDAALNPLPVGVAGELFIGGDGLARGYLGRPDLTAEKFLPDPFGLPGARRYATGDLARRRTDGTLEFLGRIDQQVKIRGFRIELGEIESALRSHPSVRAAAVAAREDRPGDRRLVAYVVGDDSASAAILREHIRLRLPDYMIPAVFIPLESLPLTPNGKLDRRALPVPAAAEFDSDFVAPRNALERVLAEVWRELLGVERVGAHDNFFASGGHSLLAAQALTRIRKIFQIDLSLRTFFEAATPEKVAQALLAADSRAGRVSLIAEQLLRIRAMSPEERARLGERRQRTAVGPLK